MDGRVGDVRIDLRVRVCAFIQEIDVIDLRSLAGRTIVNMTSTVNQIGRIIELVVDDVVVGVCRNIPVTRIVTVSWFSQADVRGRRHGSIIPVKDVWFDRQIFEISRGVLRNEESSSTSYVRHVNQNRYALN